MWSDQGNSLPHRALSTPTMSRLTAAAILMIALGVAAHSGGESCCHARPIALSAACCLVVYGQYGPRCTVLLHSPALVRFCCCRNASTHTRRAHRRQAKERSAPPVAPKKRSAPMRLRAATWHQAHCRMNITSLCQTDEPRRGALPGGTVPGGSGAAALQRLPVSVQGRPRRPQAHGPRAQGPCRHRAGPLLGAGRVELATMVSPWRPCSRTACS